MIEVENLSKLYRLGSIGSTTLRESLNRRWYRLIGKEELGRRIGEKDLMIPPDHPQAGPEPNTFWALKDVSFTVDQGDIVGIIGRNGAGKSTLLKVLTRITEPTSGRALLRGRVGSLLEVGTGFHPELTGRENIFLNGAILGMRRREIERKFDEIVAFAEVERFIDTPVKRYSSGMYVRLAFAVAAHLDPEILLVDEVLAVGDAAFQKKCLGKMKDVAGEGRTVLFVSHNMAAVSQLCQRAMLLEQGRVAREGSASHVIKDYLALAGSPTAERSWPDPEWAPGDERVRLLRARLLQAGQLVSVVDINQPLTVELAFTLPQPAHNLVTGASFYSSDGLCLFASCDWRDSELEAGTYLKRAEIPAFTFAEGDVSVLVQLVFYAPEIASVVLPDCLLFRAVDSDSPLSVRGHYKGPWPGVVRLAVRWSDAELAGGGLRVEHAEATGKQPSRKDAVN